MSSYYLLNKQIREISKVCSTSRQHNDEQCEGLSRRTLGTSTVQSSLSPEFFNSLFFSFSFFCFSVLLSIHRPRPHLALSIVGGAKNFHMDGRKKETFKVALYLNFINLRVWNILIWRLLLQQGAFFNCSSQFSVPKWKTSCSQPELLFQIKSM